MSLTICTDEYTITIRPTIPRQTVSPVSPASPGKRGKYKKRENIPKDKPKKRGRPRKFIDTLPSFNPEG